MKDNDTYWPNGFFEELVALFTGDPDEESRSVKLSEMHSSAGEELAADVIAQPRRVHSEWSAQQAAFEAGLEAERGRGLDMADLVVHEASNLADG